MVQSGADSGPLLTVVSPGAFQGATWHIGATAAVLGRAADADLRVEEPTVSRRHARFERQGSRTLLTDLGSSSGTTVNRRPVLGPVELRDGDEVGVAALTLRFRASAATHASPPTVGARHASYVVDHQEADHLNNVGGDQYNQYLQTVHEQRDGFLRDIAATRTRARALVWIGLTLAVAGSATFFAMFAQLMSEDTGFAEPVDPLGPDVGGVPLGFIGLAVGGLGMLMMKVGFVLHIVATARRRRVEREIVAVPPAAFRPNHMS